MSQQELAQKVGISRVYLNQIENLAKIPSLALSEKIASQFGKTTAEMEAELKSENCGHELLVLKVTATVKKVIERGDAEEQERVIKIMESLLDPEDQKETTIESSS